MGFQCSKHLVRSAALSIGVYRGSDRLDEVYRAGAVQGRANRCGGRFAIDHTSGLQTTPLSVADIHRGLFETRCLRESAGRITNDHIAMRQARKIALLAQRRIGLRTAVARHKIINLRSDFLAPVVRIR